MGRNLVLVCSKHMRVILASEFASGFLGLLLLCNDFTSQFIKMSVTLSNFFVICQNDAALILMRYHSIYGSASRETITRCEPACASSGSDELHLSELSGSMPAVLLDPARIAAATMHDYAGSIPHSGTRR